MIFVKYKPEDLRYIFLYSDKEGEMSELEKHLNKIPQYMFLPSFSGVPRPTVFLNKFHSKNGRLIYYCHSGLWKVIYDWCETAGIAITGIDSYFKYNPDFSLTLEEFINYVKGWNLNISPRDYQYTAAWKILKYRQSLSQLATRAGKTLIAYLVFRYLLEHGARKILMIVPSIHLVKQGVEDMKEYKEFFQTETVWAKSELCDSANLTIGTFQSLIRKLDRSSKNYNPRFFNKYDIVLCDECHQLTCKSINTILSQDFMKGVKIKFGFSGTIPLEGTIESYMCHSLMGPTIQDITSAELIEEGYLAKPNIVQINIKYEWGDKLRDDYIKCGEYLCSNYILDESGKRVRLDREDTEFTIKDQKRLPYALKEIKERYSQEEYLQYLIDLCKAKGSNLLLLEQMLVHRSIKHLNTIINILTTLKKNCIVFAHNESYIDYLEKTFKEKFPNRPIYKIKGTTSLNKRLKIIESIEKDEDAVLVASYKCVGTGLTFKNIDYGVFAQSFKSRIISLQSIGRLMLKNEAKDEFYLYDIIDCFPTRCIEMQGRTKVKLYKNEKFNYTIRNIK